VLFESLPDPSFTNDWTDTVKDCQSGVIFAMTSRTALTTASGASNGIPWPLFAKMILSASRRERRQAWLIPVNPRVHVVVELASSS
jgi:hypothetical protein